jgi:hypothetical protein
MRRTTPEYRSETPTGMADIVKPKPGLVLSSTHVVRALDIYGKRYRCDSCNAKMFVRYASGLCPRCYNGHTSKDETVSQVLYDFERGGTDDIAE